MSLDFTDDKSTLVQVMAWRHKAITWANVDPDLCHHMVSLGHNKLKIRRLQDRLIFNMVNTLRPRQNGRHFTDGIFKCIFLNENAWILIKISMKFVPKGPINNIPALVKIMAWRHPGDKPLSEPMMVSLTKHICVTRPQWVNPYTGKTKSLYWDGPLVLHWFR